nr:unnamed protein product [Digitaria exilis]
MDADDVDGKVLRLVAVTMFSRQMVPTDSQIAVEENSSTSVDAQEQVISVVSRKDKKISTTVVQGASSLESPKSAQEEARFMGKGGKQQFGYQPNVHNSQPQTLFSGGYLNHLGQWEEYPYVVSAEGLDAAYPVMHGTYSPLSTFGDSQSYFSLVYPLSSPYYQPLASPSMGYSSSTTGISQFDPMHQYYLPDELYYSPTPGFHQAFGSFDGVSMQSSGIAEFFGQESIQVNPGLVNGSGQFCGVAEMIGPVDFDRSVDYWQKDRWSGQFPVKWHIVKDVPNKLVRHIILENNENKRVTNSRDAQEVKLEQGVEMLAIFKNHEAETTILEDFDFYEQQEKAILDDRQQQNVQCADAKAQKLVKASVGVGIVAEISDTFAQALQLEEARDREIRQKIEDTAASDNASAAPVETERAVALKTAEPGSLL